MSVVRSPHGFLPPEPGPQTEDSSREHTASEVSQTLDTTASRSEAPTPLATPGAPSLRVFEDDELIAFRYRIRGLLGRGGMGEVYEAEDLELGERVALKVLRRELAERPGALEQLKRELALARKVSHPHVCRLFDVGFHVRTGPRGPERLCFLTMELLQGESLSALLRRTGPLPPTEVLPLAQQLGEGLLAAHEAGIVHRDLKSSNVLLVPGRPGTPPRAVITDFGLARLEDEAQVAPTGPGTRLAGTPAYMAPEQLEGGPIPPATDLYALGILLFELLTGTRPFQGEDVWSTARQRLHAPAPSPRSLRPGLDRRWEALVLRCLERLPEHRFQRAHEVLAALPPAKPARPLVPGLRVEARGALRLLALSLGSLLTAFHLQPSDTAPTRLAPARRSVALLDVADRTSRPDTAWLSIVLSQGLAIELRAGERIRLVSRGGEAKAALSLPDADTLPPETLARLRGLLGSEFVLRGSYALRESPGATRLHLVLRLQDTATGALVALVEESGPLDQPLPLLTRAGARLREALGVPDETLSPPLESDMPSRLDTLRLYAEGMTRLRQQDGAGAQALFEQLIALEPEPTLPHARLATALVARGERGRAQEEFRKLLSRPERLSLKGRLDNEAQSAMYARDKQRAVELYQQYVGLFADEPEGALSLAGAQLTAGDPAAALATLAKLRARSPPPVFAVALENTEAKAALRLRDFPRAQAAADRAAVQAMELKDWYSAGVSRGLEAEALTSQGARERAREVLRDAVRLFRRSGNRSSEAAAVHQQLALLPVGDLKGGLQVAREAKALYAELGHSAGLCMTLGAVAEHAYLLGEPREALRTLEEALPLCHETRLPRLEMEGWRQLGVLHRSLGALDAAGAAFREQLRIAREQQNLAVAATALLELAELALVRGDLAEARRLQDEARGLPQASGQHEPENLDGLRQARLAFEEGHLDEAGRLADAAVTSVPELFVPEAHLLQARILLAQQLYKEANVALLEAGEPSPVMTWIGLKLQSARLRAARGEASEREAARASLQELLARAGQVGWLEGQYEARLALAEVELASGRRAAGLARLEALERDARKSGLGLWATKAARLR
ncbi:serine/threonine protein kinase [Archangium gephyra]|uniref:Serine/threonine protein kinase n=1 Tax=Archangium gephyra TaxID=48 RepID=A0AAC8TAZ5_9BACT|nr:serine/threonine-protein kinase [Archangium gephyra]AKI99386.1 serine/threonine protein kinase [Archangium gephyra]REG28067.1 serine/threonine protein kinase [Archangium gephyra]